MSTIVREPVVAPVVTEADVLRRAAYLFEESVIEWVQAPRVDPNVGNYCIMAAVVRAENTAEDGEFYPSDALVQMLGFTSAHEAWEWNDAEGRTREEVIARLREAAEAAS